MVLEDTLLIEDVEDYVAWDRPFWDAIDQAPEYIYPKFWIWGYKPEIKNGWINWSSEDLSRRYLKYYPSGEYYE